MSTRAPCPSELSVVASSSATGIPYWLTPAKITALPLFEFGAPTCRRSGESYIIRANTCGVRLITRLFTVGLLLIAASAPALNTEPGGTRHSKAASVPFDTGRSWNG